MGSMNLKEWKNRLWAKSNPFKPLWMHLLETGIVAQELVSKGCFYPLGRELCANLGLEEKEMLAFVGYMASVHDIGKAAGPFQALNENLRLDLMRYGIFCDYPNFRHEDFGQFCLNKLWKKTKRFSDRYIRSCLSTILQYHHQKTFVRGALRKCIEYEKLKNPFLDEVQVDLEGYLWEYFSPPDINMMHVDAGCTLLLGIIITSDWIASGDSFSNLDINRSQEQVVEDTRRLMQEFLKRNFMLHREFPERIHQFTNLWPQIPRAGMRPLQSMAERIMGDSNERPLAIIMEAPMGEGKTEAGLYMAAKLAQRWGKEGFYVALPTAATSNQMHERVDRMLQSLSLSTSKLMHGMAWVIEDDEDKEEPEFYGESAQDALLWTAPMRRGMIAPFAVGTIDQAMMAAMRTKYGVLRLAGLAQKVLIIDEMHSYDAYMGAIIKKLLCWCRALHVPVIMLSATLPLEKKRDFSECYSVEEGTSSLSNKAYPLITLLYEDKPAREIPVIGTHQKMVVKVEQKPLLGQADEIAKLVKERMELHAGCFGVILNTVREAQETYRAIKRVLKDDSEIFLFHARFSVKRRNELEQKCIRLLSCDEAERPKRLVLVATQVVEQSLDLDFDYLISDLCPIDLLLQRVGRLWRHEETIRPVGIKAPCFTVLVPENSDFKSSGIVYPSILLERTRKVIQDNAVFHLPEDIPNLVEKIYAGYVMDEREMEQWMEYHMSNQMNEGEAALQELPMPGRRTFWLEEGHSKNRDIFYSDDDTEFLPAKTRLGELSIRLAILPKNLFDEVRTKEKPSRSMAKKVLQYSVTVAERKVKFLKAGTFQDGEKVIEGRGLLYGVWMLIGETGTCRFDDGHIICMSDEMGLLIDDEGELLIG